MVSGNAATMSSGALPTDMGGGFPGPVRRLDSVGNGIGLAV
jgi:hypothetical protein